LDPSLLDFPNIQDFLISRATHVGGVHDSVPKHNLLKKGVQHIYTEAIIILLKLRVTIAIGNASINIYLARCCVASSRSLDRPKATRMRVSSSPPNKEATTPPMYDDQ